METQTRLSRPALPWNGLLAAVALALALAGCGDSGSSGGGPTGSSVTIGAPAIVGPNGTSPVADTEPTLTVTNATTSNGSTPTYTFQVASDQSFNAIVVQASGIAQGAGQTSWKVSEPLNDGGYFWRARADVGGTQGPFSSVAQLKVNAVGAGPGETLLLFDPLTGGSSLAKEASGGTFLPEGWKVNANEDFLRYEVSPFDNGYVQWQNVGLTPLGANESATMLFGMWDPTVGNFRQNAFRVNVQKLFNPPHNPPFIRLRWISQGREEEGGYNFTAWDPNTVYTWRIDWGPGDGAFVARLLLDGNEIIRVDYERAYQPDTQWIELGVAERQESVINAVYRNFAVVRRREP